MTISDLSTGNAGRVPGRESRPTWEAFARELGHNLVRAREATGLSQERVAHAAGIASYTYQKFEKGESKPGTPMNPRLTTLVALSQVLDVPLVDLLPRDLPDQTSGR
ncbi:Transcriptional regulator, XRE family [Nocardioides sp. PD653]|nr:Transcriptional regulator, XRE family [Nocardioides sp. PD653-B2]GAW52650.1 Transcriptional regulator, XRE family [Nocardioides sp. PD653]